MPIASVNPVDQLPKHIAIVMDGNGRWAKKRFLPRSAGHRAGVKRTREIVAYCGELGIKSLSLFAFSQENWSRPAGEVGMLMSLLLESLQREAAQLHRNHVRLKIIGDTAVLSPEIQATIAKVEALTADNTRLQLNVAINYSGQWDMVQACQQLCEQAANGSLSGPVTAQQLEAALSTADQPLPDLLIRTSGEIRLSNFFLWQIAYSELYFTDLPWPAFDRKALDEALAWYQSRERRFGQTSQQLQDDSGR